MQESVPKFKLMVLKAQRRALETYCKVNNVADFKLFSDEGISGSKEHRPGLDALMEAISRDTISSVVVYSFSRFARSTKHLLNALEFFKSKKHRICFVIRAN